MPRSSLAQRYLEAWNSHDPSRIVDFFNKDATYTDSGLHQQVQGRGVGHYIEKIITLCPDVSFELLDGAAMGAQRAAIQWRAKGSGLHKLCPQLQLDKLDTLCGLDYIVHDRGRLISTHVYFDLQPFEQPLVSELAQPKRQYSKSGLSDDQREHHYQQLLVLMEQRQLYLHNDLTLQQLAEELALSSNHLSQVINGASGENFYEFINRFRLERAQQILRELPAERQMSTLDIAFESGFGSVSAFYRAFQQQLGLTPVQYRNRYK